MSTSDRLLLKQTNMLLRSELGFANKRVRELTEEVADLTADVADRDAEIERLRKNIRAQIERYLALSMENAALQERPMKRRPTLVDTGHVVGLK